MSQGGMGINGGGRGGDGGAPGMPGQSGQSGDSGWPGGNFQFGGQTYYYKMVRVGGRLISYPCTAGEYWQSKIDGLQAQIDELKALASQAPAGPKISEQDMEEIGQALDAKAAAAMCGSEGVESPVSFNDCEGADLTGGKDPVEFVRDGREATANPSETPGSSMREAAAAMCGSEGLDPEREESNRVEVEFAKVYTDMGFPVRPPSARAPGFGKATQKHNGKTYVWTEKLMDGNPGWRRKEPRK